MDSPPEHIGPGPDVAADSPPEPVGPGLAVAVAADSPPEHIALGLVVAVAGSLAEHIGFALVAAVDSQPEHVVGPGVAAAAVVDTLHALEVILADAGHSEQKTCRMQNRTFDRLQVRPHNGYKIP